ncbi:two-component system osmolarity sensor histidine kinase EnvZ [Novosphingobium hassiacum]|uniref:histidine kinase n=1 Tax=Novosphingobium hassiacum TaxID=173676 RepID=A0A7W5ZW60_9SPHN|nr:ATP-binding protein [Novosphingobium hassiacum]MBB3859574.1 two-component system osmolarity sensor histidine kinase EnvZ [Novosphingobium hassiacum]
MSWRLPALALPRSMLRRNVALMVGVVLAGQVVAGLLVMALVIQPQVNRIAQLTADMISVLTHVMEDLPEAERKIMLSRFESSGNVLIRLQEPADNAASQTLRNRVPNFIERQFVRALSHRLGSGKELKWQRGADDRLWFEMQIGTQAVWISVTPPSGRSALQTMLYAFLVAFIVAAAAGLLLQRRLDAPLQRLAAQVDAFAPDMARHEQILPMLETTGPDEVAAVASAFNRLTERLANDEAERTLMLAGVSHDLRTPLTRLRLCLEMMSGHDDQIEATAARQVDRIEAMLQQFLDFARGFAEEAASDVSMAELLAGVARDVDPQGQTQVVVDKTLRANLRYQAVTRAVGNLLGNAIRYGQRPTRLHAHKQGSVVVIEVSDAGQGFSAASAEQLRRPFARGDNARGGDGAGLGLAIAERVAVAHAGSLRFAFRHGRFCAELALQDQILPSQ